MYSRTSEKCYFVPTYLIMNNFIPTYEDELKTADQPKVEKKSDLPTLDADEG